MIENQLPSLRRNSQTTNEGIEERKEAGEKERRPLGTMSSDNNNKEGARLNYVDGYGYIELSKRMNYDLMSKAPQANTPHHDQRKERAGK